MSVTLETAASTSAVLSTSSGYDTTTSVTSETESPTSCWFTCNDCYNRAQILGTIPSLCFPDSPFKKCFKACVECAVTAPEDKKPSLNKVFEVFKPFTDYCLNLGIISAYPQSLLTTTTRTQIFVVTEFGSTVGYPQPVVATVVEVRPGLLSSQGTLTSPSQSAVSNGSVGFSGSPPYGFIIGVVLGGISFVLVLAIGLWSARWGREKKVSPLNAADDGRGFEKPQLHSDCIPRQPAIELEGSYPKDLPEIGANEIAAHEILDPDRITPVQMPEKSGG